MSVQTDLHDALTLLEHDVAQHVSAFAAARRSVLDTAFIEAATQRVIALTQTLAASYGTVDTPAPETAQAAPVAPVAPVAAPVAPVGQPSVAESLAAALAAAANAPAV